MLATYHSSQTGPPTVTDILKSSQFDHPVKPLKSAAFSKGADLSDDFSKDLSLLSTPPTPAGVHDTNPLEREKAILYQQLLDVRAEVKDLEFHLEDLRGRKAKEGGKKKGGPPVVETDGLESVLDYLLQINNATFLASPPPAMEKSALAAPAKPAPPVAKETPQAEASEQVNVAKEVMSDVQIRRLAVFTKIIFTETSNRLISTENGVHIRQYDLSGSAHDLRFRVTFDVDEQVLAVQRLEIKVAHGARREMELFIRSVEDDCNLHAFFKGLVHYGQLNRQRRALFNRLRDTFPPLVRPALESDTTATAGAKRRATEAFGDVAGDGVACLVFRDGSPTSPELVFAWDISVTPEGHAVPSVRMLPWVTRQWTAADKKGVLNTLPAQFLRLVEVRGLQCAVEVLVRAVFRVD